MGSSKTKYCGKNAKRLCQKHEALVPKTQSAWPKTRSACDLCQKHEAFVRQKHEALVPKTRSACAKNTKRLCKQHEALVSKTLGVFDVWIKTRSACAKNAKPLCQTLLFFIEHGL
jgi:hypothetical protein